jgi:hypothetical protein
MPGSLHNIQSGLTISWRPHNLGKWPDTGSKLLADGHLLFVSPGTSHHYRILILLIRPQWCGIVFLDREATPWLTWENCSITCLNS